MPENKILRIINYNGENYNIDAVSADTATLATSASTAGRLTTPREIDGVVFDGSASITHYGVCSDSGSTAAKTVSITGLTTSPSIPVGSKIAVRFTNSNAVANPTLNVNNSGAKPIYFGGEAVALDVITANKIYDFVYDTIGGVACWSIVGGASTSAAEPVTYGVVDPSNQYDGLMPYQDKTKLDAMHVSDVIGTTPISVTTASGIATVTHTTGGANTSKGDTTNQTPSFGGTFKVTSLTVDEYGHTTTLADHTVTIPNHTVTDTAGDVGLMTAADKVKLNNAVNTSITATTPIQASASTGAVTLTHANSGVTADTYGTTATAAVEPGFNDTFTVPGFTVDAKGHITAAGEHTIKIPNSTADGTDSGLMSAANFTKLSGIASGAQVNVIESIKVNGTAQTITNKAVDIIVPTKFSDLTNDGAITAIKLSNNSSAETPAVSGNTRTVTIPLATDSADGLLSKNDKALLTTLNSAVVTIAGNNVSIKNGSLDAATLRSSLGLSSAMHFIGKATVVVADNSTTNPTINGYDFGINGANATAGDVIIDKDNEYEFVWDGSAWRRLGPNGSYATSDHTHDVANGSTAGFMSAADFTKLGSIASGATAVSFSRNLTSGTKIGTITINGTSTDLYSTNWTAFQGATSNAAGTAGYINAVPAAGNTGSYFGSDGAWHGNATAEVAGLMSSGDKSKLDGVASNATNTTVYAVSPILAHTSSSGTTAPTNGTGTIYIKHNTSGPSSSGDTSKGDTSAQTPGFGETFKVTSGTVDKYGHTKTFAEHTVTIPNATASGNANGLMSSADYTKLSGIASGAEVNTIKTISVNSTNVAPDASRNVNITIPTALSDFTNDVAVTDVKIQTGDSISTSIVVNHVATVPLATSSQSGLMSAADKTKLNGISSGAAPGTVTSIITGVGLTGGPITNSGTIKVKLKNETTLTRNSSAATETEGRIYPIVQDLSGYLAVNVPWTDTTYSNATSSADGLMSSADKTKLDGIHLININNEPQDTGNIYAPTSAGTSGQVLVSSGSGAPTWKTVGYTTINTGYTLTNVSKIVAEVTNAGVLKFTTSNVTLNSGTTDVVTGFTDIIAGSISDGNGVRY